jgi:hypothetical protein
MINDQPLEDSDRPRGATIDGQFRTGTSPVDSIPEIERAVVSMLNRVSAIHHVLRAWVRQIASDPGYARYLNDFEVDAQLRLACERSGYRWCGSPPYTLEDLIATHQAYDVVDLADIPTHAGTTYADAMTDLAARFDEAIYRLALALVFYRRCGRPSGEFRPEFQTLAGPFGLTTNSLGAAAIRYTDVMTELVWIARDGSFYVR